MRPYQPLKRRAGALALVAFAAPFLAACGPSEPDPAPAKPPLDLANAPNVLLITLDTTRADRLGCYGYEYGNTPTMDALATEGVLVERAYAHVPLTLPSHATILSGVHPPGHGLHVNFQGALPAELPTLAERFHGAGYRTAAVVSAWVLDESFGLGRGFEVYDDVSHIATGTDQRAERPANEVVDAALRWFETDDERPFFAWLHFFDPHDPYEPPSFYAEGLASMYDGELAFVDSQLARLFKVLDARGELEDLVVVLTADHGESLGEHQEATHGVFIYDATMHVPLIVRAPGRLPAGTRAVGPVGLVDLAPTVLDLVGLPAVAGHEGASLTGMLRGEAFAARPVLLESEYPRRSFGWARLFALVSGDDKVIRAPRTELFDLGADPGETTNLAPQHEQRAAELVDAVERRLASLPRRSASQIEATGDEESRLVSLGYVAGATGSIDGEDDLSLRDPKDVPHVLSGVMRARSFAKLEQHERVVSTLTPLALESPESDELFALLGKAQLDLLDFAAAEESLKKSLRERPDQAGRLVQLGDAVRSQGRLEEALALYTRAVDAEPNHGQAHSRLGFAHGQAGRFDLALHHFRRFVELDPTSPNAQTNLANALLSTGRHAEGIGHLRRALELDPRCEPAHHSLWRALVLVNQRVEAIGALRDARSVVPGDRSLARELAWLLATTQGHDGAPGEALALAESVVANERPLGATSLDLLAAAAADAGDFGRAVAEAESALEAAQSQGPAQLVEPIRARLELYRAGRAYREATAR